MAEYLLMFAERPWIMAVMIILATYILEDAAIISAALISADGLISPELAFLSLFLGIFSGDAGLYAIGHGLSRWPWLAKRLNTEKINKAGKWLKKRMVRTILMVRLIPGLRLPSYIACGVFRLPLGTFIPWVFVASLLWTSLIFLVFFVFGSLFWSELTQWKWFLLPVFILLILAIQKKIATTPVEPKHEQL